MPPTSTSFMHDRSESQSKAATHWERQETEMIQNFLTPSSLDFSPPGISCLPLPSYPFSLNMELNRARFHIALLEMPNTDVQTATTPTNNEESHEPEPEPELTTPSASDKTSQHVSIDIVCHRDQLGHIMGILVGLTTLMTVRLGDRSL